MSSLGSFGVEREAPEELTFEFFGSTVRIDPAFGELDIAEFMEDAEGIDEKSPRALQLVMRALRSSIHPGDFKAFWAAARKHHQGLEDLMDIWITVVKVVTNRPTTGPSDSSDGPSDTQTPSVADSSSPVIARLEAQGRPDLALIVAQAQDSRASA